MYVARQHLPRIVEIGVSQTLRLEVYLETDSAQATASAGTVTVYLGSLKLVDAAAVTVGGSYTATYSLAGSLHETKSPQADYLEVWELTIGGETHTFRQSGYLVRTAWHPTIVDQDLIDLHSDLEGLRSRTQSSFEPYRRVAGATLQKRLLATGRRPWLIFDAWELTEAHSYLSLHLIFSDFASSVGDGRYEKLTIDYLKKYNEAFSSIRFRYDAAESGTIDTPKQVAADATLYLTSGPVNSWRMGGRHGYR